MTTPAPNDSPRWSLYVLLALSVAGAIVVAVIGFAGSYAAVRTLALDHGVSPGIAAWLPLGVDAGIVVFLALDLALTMLHLPAPLLRPMAHVLTAATVWFNAAGAWEARDPVGVGLHAVLPVLFVVAIAAARHAAAQLAGIATGTHMDAIRLSRWLLAPVSTFLLWRRMTLWEVTSYTDALTREKRRQLARAELRQTHGRHWRRACPRQTRVLLKLGELAPAETGADTLTPEPAPAPVEESKPQRRKPGGKRGPGKAGRPTYEQRLAAVRGWAQGKPDKEINAEAIRRELHCAPEIARQLRDQLKAEREGARRPHLVPAPPAAPHPDHDISGSETEGAAL